MKSNVIPMRVAMSDEDLREFYQRRRAEPRPPMTFGETFLCLGLAFLSVAAIAIPCWLFMDKLQDWGWL